MNNFAFYGLRGGVGVTSIVAALGYALHCYGRRVLLVDLAGDGMLGLHFNCPVSSLCVTDDQTLWEVNPGLQLLTVSSSRAGNCEGTDSNFLRNIIANLAGKHDVVVFDAADSAQAELLADWVPSLQPIVVANADPAAHIRLQREYDGQLLLVNGFIPESRLQSDLLMLWQHQPQLNLLPLALHRDEAWSEALACKQPVGLARPDSQAASEATSLAVWCMARKSNK